VDEECGLVKADETLPLFCSNHCQETFARVNNRQREINNAFHFFKLKENRPKETNTFFFILTPLAEIEDNDAYTTYSIENYGNENLKFIAFPSAAKDEIEFFKGRKIMIACSYEEDDLEVGSFDRDNVDDGYRIKKFAVVSFADDEVAEDDYSDSSDSGWSNYSDEEEVGFAEGDNPPRKIEGFLNDNHIKHFFSLVLKDAEEGIELSEAGIPIIPNEAWKKNNFLLITPSEAHCFASPAGSTIGG